MDEKTNATQPVLVKKFVIGKTAIDVSDPDSDRCAVFLPHALSPDKIWNAINHLLFRQEAIIRELIDRFEIEQQKDHIATDDVSAAEPKPDASGLPDESESS